MENTLTIKCAKCGETTEASEVTPFARYKCNKCDCINEVLDFSIQEWLGFNYNDYLLTIIDVVKNDTFPLLRAETEIQALQGKLNINQIDELRNALITTFKEGRSIKYLADQIKENVKPGNLDVVDEDGNVLYTVPESLRNINIARTESSRTANLGTEKYYKQQDVKQYSWIASTKACPDCMNLNGKIFGINSGEIPPRHVCCRCTIGAVVNLGK